jgi:hypothetical protein
LLPVQSKSLAEIYSSKTDDELIALAADAAALVDEARPVLADELLRRNITVKLSAAFRASYAHPVDPPLQRKILILLSMSLLAACVFFFFFFGSAAMQHERSSPHPPPPGRLLIPLWLLPFPVSLYLLLSGRAESVRAGSGVACGHLGGFLLCSPVPLLQLFFFIGFGGPDRELLFAGAALLLLIGLSLSIVRSTWRIGRVYPDGFRRPFGLTVVYLFVGLFTVLVIGASGYPR